LPKARVEGLVPQAPVHGQQAFDKLRTTLRQAQDERILAGAGFVSGAVTSKEEPQVISHGRDGIGAGATTRPGARRANTRQVKRERG